MISIKKICGLVSLSAFALAIVGCNSATKQPLDLAGPSSSEPLLNVTWTHFEEPMAQAYQVECKAIYEQSIAQFRDIENKPRFSTALELLNSLNELDLTLDSAMGKGSLYQNVHPNEQVRDAASTCEQNFVGLFAELGLSKAIFKHLEQMDQSALDVDSKRFAQDMIKGFQRSGVNLPDNKRQELKDLIEKINKTGQDFSKNIRDDVKTVYVDSVDELKGLPQDYIDNHPVNADGKIAITTNYPDYVPVMQYAENDALRKKLYLASRNRGYPDNEDVLMSLLEQRYQLAKLLGYRDYAQYVTEEMMIKTPENAAEFIEKVSVLAKPQSTNEYEELLSRLQKINPQATAVGDWQKTYLEDLIKKEKYAVDSQQVREYFNFNNVQDGIFKLTEKLFSVQIKPWATEVWDPSVRAYELWDGENLIGKFYLDMHPREGKYNHAAAFGIRDGVKGVQIPIKALVCNFPSGDASMEHSDVETFLHEFGHLLHGLFAGNQRWLAQSGIKTEWDFVEAPSQMLEEWVWNEEFLKTFAINAAGETIPDALIKKMNAGRKFGKGMWTRHQMFYASVSLNFYNQAPINMNMDATVAELQNRYSNFNFVEGTHFQDSFGHLDGYSAIYYTYMWSLVIASDMYTEFEKGGLLNSEIGDKYRRMIMEPGGTKDAADLVENFLGRPYSFDAFADSLRADK